MPLTNTQYDAILRQYQEKQIRNKRAQDQRIRKAYSRFPAWRRSTERLLLSACARPAFFCP